jgi:hypothetical protein
MKSKYLLAVLAATLFTGMSAFAGSTGSLDVLRTAEQAKSLPEKANVMMACGGCQTMKPIDKTGIAAWFGTKEKHDCPACGGKITYTGAKAAGGGAGAKFAHTCSMCGDASAYVCATH